MVVKLAGFKCCSFLRLCRSWSRSKKFCKYRTFLFIRLTNNRIHALILFFFQDNENDNQTPELSSTLEKIDRIEPRKIRQKFLKFLQLMRSYHYANRLIYDLIHLYFWLGLNSSKITLFPTTKITSKSKPTQIQSESTPHKMKETEDSFKKVMKLSRERIVDQVVNQPNTLMEINHVDQCE